MRLPWRLVFCPKKPPKSVLPSTNHGLTSTGESMVGVFFFLDALTFVSFTFFSSESSSVPEHNVHHHIIIGVCGTSTLTDMLVRYDEGGDDDKGGR